MLGLVTTFGRPTISVFIHATQSGHPSMGKCNEYVRWFYEKAGENGKFCIANRTAGILA